MSALPEPDPDLLGSPHPWLTWTLLHGGAVLQPDNLAHQGLRTRSPAVADALARAATGGQVDAAGLRRRVLDLTTPEAALGGWRVQPFAALAMIWAGAPTRRDDVRAAALAFEQVWDRYPPTVLGREQQLVAAQVLYLAGRHAQLEALLPGLRLHPTVRHSLRTDLANPWSDQPVDTPPREAHPASWPQLLSQPFVEAGLAPVGLAADLGPGLVPFDRLTATGARPGSAGGELVTVVMPCFRPDEGLLTSVRSISRQTWGDLEIVIVDDCSGPEHQEIFERAAALDPRARVLRLARNGGAYLAREAAIARSRGAYITFQDADDWSHPQRIEHQVQILTGSSAPLSRSHAVRAKDDLTHQWLGYRPVRANASSTLVRREVLDTCGGFLPVRKGADSEFLARVQSLAGPLVDTRTPLAVTRLRSGSLSRGDFTLSWFAPERLAFRSGFEAWHRQLVARARTGEPLGVGAAELQAMPFPVPPTFVRGLEAEASVPSTLARAYLGSFATDDPSPSAGWLLEHLRRGTGQAGPTGIWHAEGPWSQPTHRPHLSADWADLIQATPGLRPLCRTDPVRVDHMVVVDPRMLALATGQPCLVRAGSVDVWLTPEQVEPDSSLLPADLLGLADVVTAWWGVRPRWVLAPHLDEDERTRVRQALPGLALSEGTVRPR